MIEKVREITKEFTPRLIDFCQRIIQVPSLSGDEAAVAEVVMEEMKKLGYDDVFRDAWGNITGLIHGKEAGPTIMYNGHMDVVTEGNPEDWEGYDPYGGEIDQCMMLDWKCEKEEMVRAIHGRGASDMKCGLAAQIYAGGVLAELRK